MNPRPPAPELATRYEQLRARILGGDRRRSVGEAIVRGQGLWAFIALVTAEAPRAAPPSTAAAAAMPLPPATGRGALLSAWTDLVVAAVRRPEVS